MASCWFIGVFFLDVGVANGRLLRIRYCEDLWLGASRAMIYRLYSWITEFARAVGMLLSMDLVVGLGCRGRSVQRHGPGERYLESTRAQTKAQAAPKLHDGESRGYSRDDLESGRHPIKREALTSFPQYLSEPSSGPRCDYGLYNCNDYQSPRPTGGSIADYRDAITSGDTAAISVYCTILGTFGTQQSLNKEVTLK